MPDFVISYVESDRPWANWAAWEIERSGFRVDLHRADRRGWSGAGAEDYTDRTHVPLLSAAYWRQAHRAAIWWWLGEAIKRHVSPILVGTIDASIPADEFLDLTGATDPTAAAKHVRRYLQIATQDNAPRKSSRLFGQDRPGFPPDLAPVWRIGPHQSDLIAGADALTVLEHTFAGARSGTTRITVTGPAGAGKTGLATEYAHRHAGQYVGCWLIEASIPVLLPVQLRELAKFRRTSEASGIWLLVLDDVADPDDIAPLPPGDWHVIVTSVRPQAASAGSAHLRLGSPVPAGAADPIDQLDGIATAIERVCATAPPAATLLHLLSALGPASVPIPMLIAGADGAISNLAGPLSSRTEMDDVIDILCAAGSPAVPPTPLWSARLSGRPYFPAWPMPSPPGRPATS